MLLLGIALSLPVVQTGIAHYAAKELNKEFGTRISIDKVAISIFGTVKLKGVLILDHHNDTMVSAARLQTNVLSFKQVASSNLQFGAIRAEALNFHLKTYKGEKHSNLDLFIKAFDNGKPGSGKFRLKADQLYVTNGHFRLTNGNAVSPRVLDFKKLDGELKNFYIKASDVYADILRLSLLDHRGLLVENLAARFSYTKTNIILDDLKLLTKESALEGDVKLTYTKEDFKDFVNKVKFDIRVDKASVASNELNLFYNEFGKNQKYYLSTRFEGPMNNFVLHDLKLLDAAQNEISGTVNFRHLFDRQGPGFYMNGNFDRITSTYSNLVAIMPRILGKSLPKIVQKFGLMDIVGNVELTKRDIKAEVYLMSELGEAETNLTVKGFNNPDSATYEGYIDLDNFNLGAVADTKMVGNATLHLEVDGKGFKKESLNTLVKGNIQQLALNGYNYRNITLDGNLRWPFYKGYLNSNDHNLMMAFNGLIDMSGRHMRYDFKAQVDYADLIRLKLIKKDTISIFKGDLSLSATGNNLNNLAGTLQVNSLSYQNGRNSYYFEDFMVQSVFDEDGVRTVTVDSKDLIEGSVTGIYDIKQLPKLVENALGSLYTNYKPHKVKKGQFLDFDLTIYNKLVEIVTPDVVVGANTTLRGHINADRGEFNLSFHSPNIAVLNNYFNGISVTVNNKNPLYNAYVSMDSIRVKNYKISDFNLVNVTQNDTLYLRSEFKGGREGKDFYNLNLYHTIGKDNKSVVGLKKSEVNFKNYLWYLNENDTGDNKIVFNKKLTDFVIDRIALSHNGQKVELSGALRDSTYKDLKLTFNDVDLNKVTPSLDSLSFGGRLNGDVSFRQNRSQYRPSAAVTIDSLSLNKLLLGNLDLQVTGDQSLRKFNVNTSIIRGNDETFNTTGNIEIINKQTMLSLDAQFYNFDLSPLTVFLKSVFPSIRGTASGRAAIVGTAKSPEIDGRLYLKNAGLKVGYLNTDFNFKQDAMVDLTEREISFRNIELTDTRFGTKGRLNGTVYHKFFKDWALDLDMSSDRLLVLNTEDSDEALFYGTAFIKGKANIKGPVTSLVISAEAESAAGTDIKIPMNNTGASGSNASYIDFLSPKEKEERVKGIAAKETRTYKGLEMSFDLNITPEAKIEIIIDKNTGHSLSAVGDGNMLLEINTLGKFNMWGDFQVRSGQYNFKYGGLIDKKFIVRQGGYITWAGDPTRATLNLEAVYKTQANPSILLENPNFNRTLPVEVVTVLTGSLTSPEPDFVINFPNVSSVLKSDLEYRLSDADTRKFQALSLLSTGSFISQNNANTAVYGSLFERAGSLINGLLADEDSKVNVNLSYVNGVKDPYAETSSQLGLTLSSQISDRITVNGQLGVPVGGVNESVIVGNVEVQLRLNEDGTLKARVFNRENDITFLGEGIGYTQGVGMTYEVNFDTFRELLRTIFRKAQQDQKKDDEGTDSSDSEFSPDYIKFIEEKNKKKSNSESTDPKRIPDEG